MFARMMEQPWMQRILGAYDNLRERFSGDGQTQAVASGSGDPADALYRRTRLRLTLLYASVLALVLLLAGGMLYYGMWQTVMGPYNELLSNTADHVAPIWQQVWQEPGATPCSPSPALARFLSNDTFVACYDSTGKLIGNAGVGIGGVLSQAPGFLNPSLAQSALQNQNGTDSDMVDSGSVSGYDLGAMNRYAILVRDPDTNQVLGVLQVGISVGGALDALHTLLTLLLILLPLVLIGATAGGYFLAQRALDPARLAFTRQQTFIADASHELRTPLALLRANADVLLRGRARFDPDDADLLEDILVETTHLTAIANNLLTLARLDSGAVHLERDVVDLTTIASGAVHRVESLAHERNITVRLGETTSVQALGDPQLLAQATLALVDNAIKYAGEGSIITLSTRREDDDAILTVEDNGPGIAPEHLPLLGQRFYRPDKARSRAAGGAGLGLSVVRSIMALHHGSLDLDSAPGEGTRASLRLQVIAAHSHPAEEPAEEQQETEQHIGG